MKGYRRALTSAGLRFNSQLVVREEFSRAGGAAGLQKLLELRKPPRAVLCTNDMVAIGALDVARARALRVPDDLAVMGFDDIEAAALISPSLTTIAGDPREQGRAVGRVLLGRLEGTASSLPQRILFAPSVVPRESA